MSVYGESGSQVVSMEPANIASIHTLLTTAVIVLGSLYETLCETPCFLQAWLYTYEYWQRGVGVGLAIVLTLVSANKLQPGREK